MLLVGSLLLLEHIDGKIRLGSFAVIQVSYFVYFLAVRPFANIKENLLEFGNECTLMLLIIFLFAKFNSTEWGTEENAIFFTIVMANAVVYLAISLGSFIAALMSDIDAAEQTRARGNPRIERREDSVGYNEEPVHRGPESPPKSAYSLNKNLNNRTTTDMVGLDESNVPVQPMSKNDFMSKGFNIYKMN